MTSVAFPLFGFGRLWASSFVMAFLAVQAMPAMAGEVQVSGFTAFESRWFPQSPKYNGQFSGVETSVVINPEFRYQAKDGGPQVSFVPFVRVSGRDGQRTHVDIREAYVAQRLKDWDYLIGLNTVFWGVAESRHLVNIINQTDALEDTDGEDKLGQAMINIGVQKNWGRFDAFVLPNFRERPFSSSTGRLRSKKIVDRSQTVFANGSKTSRMDFAGRYSHFIGDWDIGLSVFHGLSREPRLPVGTGAKRAPRYDVITQIGLDLQYTKDEWLWKFEGIVREGYGDPFAAMVGGFEYTFFQVADSTADLGLLAELHLDGRNQATAPATIFDHDVFIGTRLALNDINDSQGLIGGLIDQKDGSTALSIEMGRRLNNTWKIETDARVFIKPKQTNTLAPFKRDSFVNFRLVRSF